MRRGCGWLLVLPVIGYCVLTSTQPQEPTFVSRREGVNLNTARNVCRDSLHMPVIEARELGAARVYVRLDNKVSWADCSVQFGKIQHITVLKRKHATSR